MPKDYDVGYIWSIEDVRDILKTIYTYFISAYKLGSEWRKSHPWQTAEDGEMRAVALNMESITNMAAQTRALVSEGQLRVDRLLKEAEDTG